MKTRQAYGWVYYKNDNAKFDPDKCGKWMYYFGDKDFASKICIEAVRTNIVDEAKYRDAENGVICFYLHNDDIDGHKRVLTYFLENNLISKNKKGRLYNISFKLDKQTLSGEYGADFHSDITLSKFINLDTGEWIV